MAVPPADRSRSQPAAPRILARLVLLVLILFAETVALRLRFDVRILEAATGWWSGLLGGPSALARVAIAFTAAIVLLGGLRIGGIAREVLAQARGHRRWPFWLTLQVVSFAVTFAITSFVASSPGDVSGPWELSGTAGALAAAGALVFWFASVAPPGYWFHLVAAERTVVVASCVIAVAAWYLSEWTQDAWIPLNEWTFLFVDRILRLVYPQIVMIPERRVIGPPKFLITIGAECSGYEGIGLVCVFLAIFFWTFRRRLRFPEAWLLWPIGIVAIWICNAFRIAALVMIGTHYSADVAVRGFHSQAGWLFFNLVALGLMAAALKIPFFVRRSAAAASPLRATPVGAYLLPLLALVVMNMVIAAFSDDFDRLYPVKVIVTAAILWRYRAEYRSLGWSWSRYAAINGVFVFVVWSILARLGGHEDSEIPLRLEQLAPLESWFWLIFRSVGSVLTVPLVEELAFRGYLLRRFVSADFDEVPYGQTPVWALLVSSLLFGLMHGWWVAGTIAGLCYACAARRRGKLGDAIMAHAITNGLIAADVLLLDDWWLW